jgi:hypothetical protein
VAGDVNLHLVAPKGTSYGAISKSVVVLTRLRSCQRMPIKGIPTGNNRADRVGHYDTPLVSVWTDAIGIAPAKVTAGRVGSLDMVRGPNGEPR